MAAPLPLRNTNNNGADAGSGEEEELAAGGSAGLGGSGVGDERVARWINPCRAVSDPDLLGPAEAAADVQVVRPIRISASTALNFAEEFRDEYAMDTFYLHFSDLHEAHKEDRHSWLPTLEEIPKELGEKVPQEHLDSLKLEETLRRLFEYFQKYSVGLEKLLLDLSIYGGSHLEKFKELESSIATVLCELQVGMVLKRVTPNTDVSADVMTDDVRDLDDELQRNQRDWIIFRDTMNALEYTVEVMDMFERTSS